MKVSRADIYTPANAISLIGLGLTMYGSLTITSLHGVLLLGLGRFIDIFDGKVARATHTSSFGAILDATCDKIGIAFLVPAVWLANIAPTWLLIYILAQNILNVIISFIALRHKGSISSSRAGKYTMFLQNISLGGYALASVTPLDFFATLGLFVGILSIYWAIKASSGYYTALRSNAH
jgi:phosphatidylglycerophosphate synthase